MAEKDVSDKELDALIDASVNSGKEENKTKPSKEKAANGEKATKSKDVKAEAKAAGAAAKPEKTKTTKAKKEAALKPVEGYDPWKVLTFPHLTEKSMNLVERNNVLVFIVNMKATKDSVKDAVEKGFGARVISVNIHITKKNQKKAYVRLAEGVLASDIATRLGMI